MDKAPDAFRTISEVADDLDLPQHVLRFWETRFSQIKPMKRGGGRRYYRREDVELLRGIRHLLYGEGYTIRGVQRILKDEGVKFVQSVWKTGAPQPSRSPSDEDATEDVGSVGLEVDGELPTSEPRARGLFGILPSLLGEPEGLGQLEQRRLGRTELGSDAGNSRPEAEEVLPDFQSTPSEHESTNFLPPLTSSASERPAANLTRDELHALRATLYELGECRRLLDVALAEGG